MKKKGRTAGEKKRKKRGRGKDVRKEERKGREGGEERLERRAPRFERTLFIFKFQMKLSCM